MELLKGLFICIRIDEIKYIGFVSLVVKMKIKGGFSEMSTK